MVPPLYIVLIVIVILESSTGIALNLYIFNVNLKSMKSRQKIKPCDLIHLTKGLVNALLQLFLTMEILMVLVWFQKFFVKEVYLTCFVSLTALGFFDYWLTAFLCAYYCSTISNLSFVVFTWVKRSIATFLPQLLLVSAMGSILFSVPSIWQISMTIHEQPIWNSTNESMIIGGTLFIGPVFEMTVGIFGCYLPFFLSLLSLTVTIFSLVRHIRHIRDINSNVDGPKLGPLINATRTMLLFLAIHVSFYLSGYFCILSSSVSIDLMSIISWFFLLFCPTAEALTIIQSSSKLRDIFQVTFCSTKTKSYN
ncbi:taste receptor type 2 member 40-like [Rana temporaria]|uniref:taste receptor type 2 member 40-like n=1 Tax=Rana temporaria TaxID=8407 RepID=UPI001AAD2567|nr:taste receptor type 2 member 40-like [Rana temporaria]